MSIFKAYDIRGIVGDTLTPEIVTKIGQAIGSEAAKHNQAKVVVARDGRLSGPDLIEALIIGLEMAGREVIDIGMMPTPLLYFATFYLKTGTGVMLTGSHNPSNYNGLKIMINGETLSEESIQALKHRIDTNDLITGTGSRHTTDVHHAYTSQIHKDVKLARPFKVVIDCGNGVAGVIAPHLIETLGCKVTKLFCEVDGNFPNHHPDPSIPKNLEDLVNTVKSEGADLGLAFDGDGDRLGVVDATGRIIWPDRQMILYATDLLKRHPGTEIIYDVKCSRHLIDAIEKQGGKAT
ncbi:MAG: phosphomannomutase/phosphoglucomutase, partial [Proteobacteria bacterium]|nr:phosphomannomutase/phosphoglucomutase [Pseudomonadota bacterium]